MKPTIHKVILTYKDNSKRSTYRTVQGMEDAIRFADEWAAKDHVATVRIFRGRTLILTIK